MKAIHYTAFILIGVLLGLAAGHFLKPPAAQVAAAVLEQPTSLALARQDFAATLYARLPELSSTSVEQIGKDLRLTALAKSPARQRTELHRLLVELAADPSKASEITRQVIEGATTANNYRAILSKLYRLWAAKDPVAAMDSLAHIKTHDLRYQAMSGALRAWAQLDPTSALAYVKESSLDIVANDGANLILRNLAETDPERAFAEARLLGDAELVRSIHHTVITNKAMKNMEQTWKEIATITDKDLQNSLRSTAIEALARKDKPAALTYVDQIQDREQRQYNLMRLFRDWPLSNADEAKAAFQSYPKGALPDGVAFNFGQTMNLADSQDALDYSHSLEDSVREDYLLGVLTEQAIKQPAETAAIVQDYLQEDGQLRQIYRHLGEAWAGKDEHAAAEWVASLPESSARDEAVSSFSKKLFSIDPERALQWAMSINDPKERSRHTDKLVEQWRTKDAKVAEQWLAKQGK